GGTRKRAQQRSKKREKDTLDERLTPDLRPARCGSGRHVSPPMDDDVILATCGFRALICISGRPLKVRSRFRLDWASTRPICRKASASWPVSRVLYGRGARGRRDVAAIHLGHMLPCASRNPPGWRGWKPP